MKTTRHSLMAKGILVLLSLLIMVFVFTYTWYLDPANPVTASGISVSTRDATTDFEYAIGFSNSQTGGAYEHTEFTNTVNADLNLEELYSSEDTNEENPINLLYDYNPTDLTGDGVTLIRPAMNYGNWDINKASTNYSIAEENVQFISFDLIFRTQERDATIRLDADSFAKGACETYAGDGKLVGAPNNISGVSTESDYSYNYNDLTTSSVTSNKYGRFSRDAIVGAVRVAFLEYEALENQTITVDNIIEDDLVRDGIAKYADAPALLWVVRPDIFLNNRAASLNDADADKKVDPNTWQLDTNVTSPVRLVSKAYGATNSYSTYQHEFYNVFKDNVVNPDIVTYEDAVASVLDTSAPANTNKVTFGTAHDLVALDCIDDANNDNVPDDGYYYGKIRVRIWIEGTDSESRRALTGGKFSVCFHITG